MPQGIRPAQSSDAPVMADLSERFREKLQTYQPHFWSKAAGSRAKHLPFIEMLIAKEEVISLVHEQNGTINGFIIATFIQSPPVYASGLTCAVDDFCVAEDADWERIGRLLLDEVKRRAKEHGATQIVVVCPHLDQPKRTMLQNTGLTIASEWYVTPL